MARAVKLEAASKDSFYLSLLRMMLTGMVLALVGLVIVVIGHAATSSAALLSSALFFAAVAGLLAATSLAIGLTLAWTGYPQHRRTMLLVVGVTLITLAAHLYTINSPAVSQPGLISASVGSTTQDSYVTLSSALQGDTLSVNVTVSGGSAIAGLQLNTAGASLSGAGFSPNPSYTAPLEPGGTSDGTWTVTGTPTQVNVTYDDLTCYDSTNGWYGCIMDESFYVPEAQGILSGQYCSTDPSVGYRCHMEHPFLTPALVAGGMAIFGEFSTLGWRIVPALLGTLSIPVLFAIAWKVSGRKDIACLSAVLLALDVNWFSISGAAILDVPMIFFGLMAILIYVWGIRFWKLDKYILTGVLFGIAALSKETAILLVFGLLTYNLIFGGGSTRKRLKTTVIMGLVVIVVFAAGLQAYDSLFAASSPIASPVCGPRQIQFFYQQVEYILCYGSSLIGGGWTGGIFGTYITPLDWLVYYTPVAYVLTSVRVCTTSTVTTCYSYVAVGYYGVTNLLETWTTWIWAPLAAYVIFSASRRKEKGLDQYLEGGGTQAAAPPSSDFKVAAFTLTMFLWTYLSYVALYAGGRVTYPFYFASATPFVAIGASMLLTQKWFPRWLTYIFVAAAFVFFFVYFPDKGFLPVWLRSAIGH